MIVEGVPCVAVMTFQGLLVTRPDAGHEGRTVAQFEWITDFANNIAKPAVSENHVLITSAYNHQTPCKLEITLDGARKIWEQPFPSKVRRAGGILNSYQSVFMSSRRWKRR